ncbi:MAG: metal ABC transporter permease [archaeon]|nr:metal ABC transporter permease [archaeon]
MTNQLILSLIVAIFAGGAAAYLGSLMVAKKMALVGDALGHVALPGMGIAILLGLNVSLGAFVFLALGILLVWYFSLKTNLSTETLVGVMFVTSLAIGFLIVPEPELLEALFGDISNVSVNACVISSVLALVSFVIINQIYSKLIMINISEDLAKSERINVKGYNLLYLFLIAVIVALGIKVTGTLLVGALVIVPAAAAKNFSKSLKQYAYGSLVIGVLSGIIGIFLYNLTGFPAGPLIVLTSCVFFLISLIFKK